MEQAKPLTLKKKLSIKKITISAFTNQTDMKDQTRSVCCIPPTSSVLV